MMVLTDNNGPFIEQVGAWAREIESGDMPLWFKELRQRGLARFRGVEIPSTKDEEWKYTDVSPVTARRYRLARETALTSGQQQTLRDYMNPGEINVVFVNGFFSQALSNFNNIPPGIKVETFQNALKTGQDFLQGFERRFDPQDDPAFIALNKGLASDGTHVAVEPGVVCEVLIHILHVATDCSDPVLVLPRTFIALGASSGATVLESHIAFSDTDIYFTDALTDIFLAENAVLDYAKAQKESLSAYHIGCTRVWQERDSSFSGFSLDVGAALTRNNVDIAVAGEGATAVLNGLYSVGGTQHVDNHTSVDHRVPHGTSNQLYKGILKDAARAVFNGKIFVRPAAQQTNSYQLNKNLLLGGDCRVDTKPQLEIFADDVKCTHGATIGQMDEDELFYLRTRAIPKASAVRLLLRGFADDLLGTLKSGSVRRQMNKLLEPAFEVLP